MHVCRHLSFGGLGRIIPYYGTHHDADDSIGVADADDSIITVQPMQMTPSAQPMPTIPSVQESADDSILNCPEGSRCVYSEGTRCFYSFMHPLIECSRGFADKARMPGLDSQAVSEYQHRSVVAPLVDTGRRAPCSSKTNRGAGNVLLGSD